MTREEHYNLARKTHDEATAALAEAVTSHGVSQERWEDYKRLSKEASKHYGIANAMWTRRMKRDFNYDAPKRR